MATKNWLTQNVPGLVEYLSGDPNAPGYRDDHGGGNYHDHLAFGSREQTLKAKKALEAAGIRVTGFGDRSGHAENSYHYSDQALDIPGAQWGKGTDKEVFAGSKRVREVLLSTFGGGGGSTDGGGGSTGGTTSGGTVSDGTVSDGTVTDGTSVQPIESPKPIQSQPIETPKPIAPIGLVAGGGGGQFAKQTVGQQIFESLQNDPNRKAGSSRFKQLLMSLLGEEGLLA